jgi:RNA polymerase sigma factor (sigma-70 family)
MDGGVVDQALIERAGRGDAVALQRLVSGFGASAPPEQNLVLAGLATAAPSSPPALGALLQLIDDHRLARRTIRLVLVDNDQVDDANQDVLIAVARSVHSFRGSSLFTTWLHSVARNVAVDHLRRRRDAAHLDERSDFDSTAARLSSMIASRSDLRAAIEALPDHYRQAVVLRDVEGRSYLEIAEVLGIKVDTVKSRISRGRALLAGSLADLDLGPGPAGA